MIEQLHLDKKQYAYGFSAHIVKSGEDFFSCDSCRAAYYQMFWVKSGEVILQLDGNTCHVMQNECAFIGLNQVFRVETEGNFEILLTRFTEDFYCRHDIDVRFLHSCAFFENTPQISKYKLHHSLRVILEQYYQSLAYICSQPFEQLMYHFAHNTIERLLLFSQKELVDADFSPVTLSSKADYNLASQFRQLVKENCRRERQVQFYADLLSVSVKRLTEICNTIYGKPPKKIITELVVLEARRLLQHSSMNIKEIAFELMFQEPSNFIRFFNNAEGMTPKEFREQFTIYEQ